MLVENVLRRLFLDLESGRDVEQTSVGSSLVDVRVAQTIDFDLDVLGLIVLGTYMGRAGVLSFISIEILYINSELFTLFGWRMRGEPS